MAARECTIPQCGLREMRKRIHRAQWQPGCVFRQRERKTRTESENRAGWRAAAAPTAFLTWGLHSGTWRTSAPSSVPYQGVMTSPQSFAHRRLMDRRCCCWQRIISWALWTLNWALLLKSVHRSTLSKQLEDSRPVRCFKSQMWFVRSQYDGHTVLSCHNINKDLHPLKCHSSINVSILSIRFAFLRTLPSLDTSDKICYDGSLSVQSDCKASFVYRFIVILHL